MESSEGTGKTAVVLVFVPLVCLRLQTDIWRLNLVFSPCRVVQNVLISTKLSFGHCPVTGSLHREASLVLLVGSAPKWVF